MRVDVGLVVMSQWNTLGDLAGVRMAGAALVAARHWALVEHPLCLIAIGGLTLALRRMWRLVQFHAAGRQRERAMREELEAYARLDASIDPGGDAKQLARRVCRAVIEKSAFRRVAMLVRSAEGKLFVAGSAGMDDLAVGALQAWGQAVMREERGLGETGPAQAPRRERMGTSSFVLELAVGDAPGQVAHSGCRRAIVTQMRTQGGGLLGALVVCMDELADGWTGNLDDAMPPIEALVIKLAQTLDHAAMTDRLMRVERLAGLGQLAGGVAHELNNPLTAVLGFAELMAETSGEPRVQQDARTIIREALQMKQTVENLVHFWRPVALANHPLDLPAMLSRLAAECEPKLQERGVALLLQVPEDVPEVRGDVERLCQVVQHLLNNAAQAIANSKEHRRQDDRLNSGLPRGADDGDRFPTIRVTVSHDARTLHLIVSDTGPGFPEPGRVFDPFYTTRAPGGGTGLGLSICYGIVREHGGEISAFNLHPHGAAVVVELPLDRTISEETETEVAVRTFPSEFGIEPTHDRRRKRIVSSVR